MKLKSVTVGGFKNLQRTKIEMQGIAAVVSTNNYGKSNLLEAIDFGVKFLSANERDRESMMRYVRGIPVNTVLAGEDYYFEICFENETEDDYRFVRYSYSFSWYRDDGKGQRITDEKIEARSNESVKYTSYLKRDEGKYRKDKNTNAFRNIVLNDRQLALDVLSLIVDIPLFPVIDAIRHIDYRVCSSLDLRDRFQPVPIEYIGDKDNNELIAFDDRDVPRAIYRLKQLAPENYDLFVEAVTTLFPEFSEISVEPYSISSNSASLVSMRVAAGDSDSKTEEPENIPFRIRDEIYRVFIKSKNINQPVEINRMSTGTKRIFWLLANVFIASSRGMSLIGVEELETSIHPKLLKNLLEFLDEVLEDTSMIISSHSPFLIQYIKPERLYVGVPDDKGTALFKRIKGTKIRQFISLARDNGMSTGEYLFELLSGDTESRELLHFYLEE